MSLAIYTSAAWTANGGLQVADNATIEVRRESDGALASIFSDREGEEPITNPSAFGDASGRFEFFAAGGAYRVKVTQDGKEYTLRYQAIGTAAAEDVSAFDAAGSADAAKTAANSYTDDHATETGGIHGIPEGERALHTGTNGGGTPIGGYVTVQTDLTGAEEPDPETHVKLEAGLTGSGQYNEGKLDNESVSGGAPLVEATAEIVDSESPLNGQTVHLLETERRFLRAGEAGTVENDQMQRITGEQRSAGHKRAYFSARPGEFAGALQPRTDETLLASAALDGVNNASDGVVFDSSDSPDARASATTDGETRAKNIGVSVYMRIK